MTTLPTNPAITMPKSKQQKAKDRERRVAKKKLVDRAKTKEQDGEVKAKAEKRSQQPMTAGVQKPIQQTVNKTVALPRRTGG